MESLRGQHVHFCKDNSVSLTVSVSGWCLSMGCVSIGPLLIVIPSVSVHPMSVFLVDRINFGLKDRINFVGGLVPLSLHWGYCLAIGTEMRILWKSFSLPGTH